MPCYARPQRTKRAIESILAQNMSNWQAYIVGDGCPEFEKLMAENRDLDKKEESCVSWETIAQTKGSEILMWNAKTHEGGYGFAIRNFVNHHNSAEFIVYLDNDDTIEKDHFENYLSAIDGTDYDFVYFDTYKRYMQRLIESDRLINNFSCGPGLVTHDYTRHSRAEEGWIGHAEIIVCSQFLKDNPQIQESAEYGHDWKFIKQMIDAGAKFAKARDPRPTYNIMGAGDLRETGID